MTLRPDHRHCTQVHLALNRAVGVDARRIQLRVSLDGALVPHLRTAFLHNPLKVVALHPRQYARQHHLRNLPVFNAHGFERLVLLHDHV